MRRVVAIVIAVAALFSEVVGASTSPAVSTREYFEVVTTNPCTGEPSMYSGTIHFAVRSEVDFSTGRIVFTATGNLQNSTIVGLETGDTYVATGQPYHETFFAKLLGPDPGEEEQWHNITVDTLINREKYVAPGGGPTVSVRYVSHITYFNDGETIVAYRDEFTLECTP